MTTHEQSGPAPRALVVHESMFGNTETIARAVAEGLTAAGYQVTCVGVDQAPVTALGVDLLVVGAPTHAFSMTRASTRADAVRQGAPAVRATTGLREWLAALAARGEQWRPPVAVFDTRIGKVRHLPSAAPAVARFLRHHGWTVVGRPMGFLVEDTAGPLRAGEPGRAAEWGRSLAEMDPADSSATTR